MGAHELVADATDRTDEAHHELGRRTVIDVARGADLLDRPRAHHRDPIRDLHRLLLIMGDKYRRRALLVVQASQPRAQLGADDRIQRAERLVEQQDLGCHRQRPGERHALALAARELGRALVGPLGQADERQQLVDALAGLGLGALADRQPEGDVVADGHVGERRVVLKDEADPPLLRADVADVVAVDADRPAIGDLESGDDPQKRGLARSGGAEQRGQRALGHLQRDVLKSGEVAEPLGDGVDVDPHWVPCLRGESTVMTSRTTSEMTASSVAAA